MTIVKEVKGNLFHHALYNSGSLILHGCNNSGFMGKGFALEFRKYYPESYLNYNKYCSEDGRYSKGNPDPTILGTNIYKRENGNHTICALTQQGFISATNPQPAKLEYIKSCVIALEAIQRMGGVYDIIDSKSIHCPRLGCGLGGLKWEDVSQILEGSTLNFAVYNL